LVGVLFLAAPLLQGCELPRSGPLMADVTQAQQQSRITLTDVTPALAAATHEPATASFPADFLQARPVDYERFAPGDGIDIVVWERDGLLVFPPNANGASDLGTFIVAKSGEIEVPYAGSLAVAGLTAEEARMLLLRRLRGIVIATDVRFTSTSSGSMVTVQGDVTKAGVFPINPGTLRLSAALGLASPDQTAPDETLVSVRRNGESGAVRLSDIYRDPTQDIALRPGDSIVVSSVQEYVTVLGAAGGQGRVKIARRNYSVLDALADSRGLADSTADARALYLIRVHETAADARPQIYHFDMRLPQQMLLAKQFVVQDGDAVFISDAPFTQAQKVLSSVSATLGTARSVSALGQ